MRIGGFEMHTVLIFGGASDERMVSVASAQNLAAQFVFDELWFLHFEGGVTKVKLAELQAHQRPFEIPFRPSGAPFLQKLEDGLLMLQDKIVFIGMHGTEGEDGTLQALFEKNSILFTGSGSHSSRLCFEKDKAKETLAPCGVLVAPQLKLNLPMDLNKLTQQLIEFFQKYGRLVVKPIANGSSIGLNFIQELGQIEIFAQEILASKIKNYLVEKFIKGRELTVGVIDEGSDKLKALPPSEVILSGGASFDYQGKYLGRGITEVTPANIPNSAVVLAQELALKAHKVLGCYGYSRTDMIWVEGDTSGMIFLETNTLPGMTKASFIPQQLQVAGISFRGFLEQQFLLAQKR